MILPIDISRHLHENAVGDISTFGAYADAHDLRVVWVLMESRGGDGEADEASEALGNLM